MLTEITNLCSSSIYKQSEVYSEPCQISKLERFVNTVNGSKPLTIFAKHSPEMFDRFLNMPLTNGSISGLYTNIWLGMAEVCNVSS